LEGYARQIVGPVVQGEKRHAETHPNELAVNGDAAHRAKDATQMKR
jgi:hypothetical protein